jgi:surfactin synthase thioesterase subunit
MNPEPGEGRLVPGRQERLTLSLLKALDLLRDGIRTAQQLRPMQPPVVMGFSGVSRVNNSNQD